ncbi:MAG: ABC transporter ATP-binding protein [Halobacteriales archaeon]|nr:ABC transporter ATP-binding protein [Halobacteriales archaeon]
MIEAVELRKEYGSFVAVEGSSFEVADGEIFGLIGPNGAGKTTTLKMLAGLIEPTAGQGTVAGYDVATQEMRRHLGFLPEESPVYEEMTPRSYLRFFADLYDVPSSTAEERIESMLDRLELEYRDRALGNVSKGMKRKVAIARSLVNDPDVLIYDEPASGLDPLTTNAIIEFVRELAAEDKTIVFSAHNLYHVESLCDRIAIMNDGRIVARGTLEEIRARHGGVEYHVYTSVPVDGSEQDGDRYRVTAQNMDGVEAIRERLADRDGELLDVRTHEASLEDIFLAVATDGTDTPEGAVAQAADVETEPEARM